MAGDFDGVNFLRFLVNTYAFLAPNPALRATMSAGVSLAFTLDLNAGAVDNNVERAGAAKMGQADVQALLAAEQDAEVWHLPVHADELQHALYKTSCLPQWPPEQHLRSQTDLERGIAAAILACRSAAEL